MSYSPDISQDVVFFTPDKELREYLRVLHPALASDCIVRGLSKLGVCTISSLKYVNIKELEDLRGLPLVAQRALTSEILKRQTPTTHRVVYGQNKEQDQGSEGVSHHGSKPKRTLDFGHGASVAVSMACHDLEIPFKYNSPLDLALEALKKDIHVLQDELDSAKDHLDELNSRYPVVRRSTKTQCSNCHIRGDHNRRHCEVEACESAQACGDLSKHPVEKQEMAAAGERVKKLEKDLQGRQVVLDVKLKQQKQILSSFDQAVYKELINSKPSRYLFQNSSGVYVPKTVNIQMDTAILSSHYKGKIPRDVAKESVLFQDIIARFNSKTTVRLKDPVNPIREKLTERGIRFPGCPRDSTEAQEPSTSTNQMPAVYLYGNQPVPYYMGNFYSPGLQHPMVSTAGETMPILSQAPGQVPTCVLPNQVGNLYGARPPNPSVRQPIPILPKYGSNYCSIGSQKSSVTHVDQLVTILPKPVSSFYDVGQQDTSVSELMHGSSPSVVPSMYSYPNVLSSSALGSPPVETVINESLQTVPGDSMDINMNYQQPKSHYFNDSDFEDSLPLKKRKSTL